MKSDPVLSMLSLAAKAGRVASGSFMAEKLIKSGKACLVIVAKDASPNTAKMFADACAYRGVDIYEYAGSDELGRWIGKNARVVVALSDEGFSESIVKKLELSGARKLNQNIES